MFITVQVFVKVNGMNGVSCLKCVFVAKCVSVTDVTCMPPSISELTCISRRKSQDLSQEENIWEIQSFVRFSFATQRSTTLVYTCVCAQS